MISTVDLKFGEAYRDNPLLKKAGVKVEYKV